MISVSLRKQFPQIRLAVDLEFDDGILVLFGPSGSGKSLTVKSIAGLIVPDGGWVRVNDQVLFDAASDIFLTPQQRRVGYVPQSASLFPHLTAKENIAMPLWRAHSWNRHDANRHALSMLDKVNLLEHADVLPAKLSGGQRQLVAFARAMAISPELILLDEPFASLDGPARSKLRLEFKRLRAEIGAPTIAITHDLEEAVLLADTLAVILNGAIHQIGPPRQVLDFPADSRVAELIQARNILPARFDASDPHLLHSDLGPLRTDTKGTPGSHCQIVIRPDVMRILREGRSMKRLEGANILQGTLLSATDSGALISLQIQIGEGTLELHLSPSAFTNLNLETGQSVRVSVWPDQIHIIPQHDAAIAQ